MRRTGRRDTTAELLVRREVHRRGLRYLVDHPLPELPRRRADLLFRGVRVAVFIDGCYWHGCPLHATSPKANAELWAAKLARNVARDRDTDAHLARIGWFSLRVWEHVDALEAADLIDRAVRDRM